jgi:hypothetical protein
MVINSLELVGCEYLSCVSTLEIERLLLILLPLPRRISIHTFPEEKRLRDEKEQTGQKKQSENKVRKTLQERRGENSSREAA